MSDARMVLAQFPTVRAAKTAASAFAKAFAAHLAAAKKAKRYPAGVTAPLKAFADDEGFEWPDEDVFRFDDDDTDPGLSIGSAGHVLLIFHAAAGSLAYDALAGFAKARGATATTYWEPDPTPGTLTVTATSQRTFDAVYATQDLDLEIVDTRPSAASVLVIKAGKKTRYAALYSCWGIGELLLELAARDGVDVMLEVAELPAVEPPPPLEGQLRNYMMSALWAMRQAKIDDVVVRAALAEMERLTQGRVTTAMLEETIPIAIANKYDVDGIPEGPPSKAVARAIAEQSSLVHKLAAARPLTQREVAMAAFTHKKFVEATKGPHRWTHVQIGPLPLAVYDGSTSCQVRFARRDARKIVFKERVYPGATFDGALLDEADFTKADVSGACFANASAVRARFDGATLAGADFTRADLTGASFKAADLRGAIWTDAILDGADFTGARRS